MRSMNASRSVLLVGNPNVGKSVLFRNLTNRYVTVANYPGTTIEIVRAQAHFDGQETEVIDTPGINDFYSRSEDARVTYGMIARCRDAVLIQVADAKNLCRALLLTLQFAEQKRPMVLALNMIDELERSGARIDVSKLGEILGIPVVTTVAVRNQGSRDLMDALPMARVPSVDLPAFDEDMDEYARNFERLKLANEILRKTYSFSQPENSALNIRIGFWAMHPFKGLVVLALVLSLVFWFVGLFAAGTLVNFVENVVFQQNLNPLLIRTVDALMPFPHVHESTRIIHDVALPLTPAHAIILGSISRDTVTPCYTLAQTGQFTAGQHVLRFMHDFAVGEYGLFTMAISYAIAIVLPIVTAFFLIFSVLEDSGYLPRLSIMVHRVFRIMGLNGKAVLPMILGLGCDTMATMTTRILETKQERIITTLLLALAVPCSAQLGVLLALTASISFSSGILWMLLIILIMVVVGWLSSKLFQDSAGEFIMEIPPMRKPQLRNVLTKTYSRLVWYMREVVPLFVFGTAILFLLDEMGALRMMADLGKPLVTDWLGLPREMANVFLIGFLRRDFGAVYLLDAATGPHPELSTHQIFVAMVTITLFMPCIANFFMIAKEHGQKIAWQITLFVFPFAFFVGGVVHRIGRWLTF